MVITDHERLLTVVDLCYFFFQQLHTLNEVDYILYLSYSFVY